MFLNLYVTLLSLELASSQLNGEFWWLNEKFAKLHNIEPPQPLFDDVSEFDTDESVKVIFKDADVSIGGDNETSDNNSFSGVEEYVTAISFQDQSALAKPVVLNEFANISDKLTDLSDVSTINNSEYNNSQYMNSTSTLSVDEPKKIPHSEDILNFVFPKDNELESDKNIEVGATNVEPVTFVNDNKLKESESICTFLKTFECIKKRGKPYSYNGRPLPEDHLRADLEVCCILPIKNFETAKILFPDEEIIKYRRIKRSDLRSESTALKQRNALMRRKYESQEVKSKLSTTTKRTILTQRIVTPEDYLDPYWNVKNSKFRNTASKGSEQIYDSKYDPSQQDYSDYALEIPKPGGLKGYLDHKRPAWTLIQPNKEFSYSNSDDISEEENISFGYSTIDPRLGQSLAMSATRHKPSRVKTISNEDSPNAASQIITFRSKPDFQVFQGFKLLNLVRSKNRFIRNTTPQDVFQNDDESMDAKPSKHVSSYIVDEYDDFLDIENQVYKDCGKTYNGFYNTGKSIGEVDCESSPWLTLVVLTRSRRSILCYATLLHPRAAVTAADCVYGTSAGEISIITGAFDLSEENMKSQHRLATVITHPQYKPGKLSNNLAVLHWKRPLMLSKSVQPACVSDPHIGDDCYFVGWGGYDEDIHQRPHWQRAFILSPKLCNARLSKLDVELPTDAFCASVDTSSTVTGVGGPLICTSNGRQAIVGVAVWRDSVILTLPVLEWTTRVVEEIVM